MAMPTIEHIMLIQVGGCSCLFGMPDLCRYLKAIASQSNGLRPSTANLDTKTLELRISIEANSE